MKRRDFLKLSLGGLAVAAVPLGLVQYRALRRDSHIEVKAFGKLFRGTPEGRLLVSQDRGENWQPEANFGDCCPVLDLFVEDDQLHAKLGFQDFAFYLKSRDGRVWRTLDA